MLDPLQHYAYFSSISCSETPSACCTTSTSSPSPACEKPSSTFVSISSFTTPIRPAFPTVQISNEKNYHCQIAESSNCRSCVNNHHNAKQPWNLLDIRPLHCENSQDLPAKWPCSVQLQEFSSFFCRVQPVRCTISCQFVWARTFVGKFRHSTLKIIFDNTCDYPGEGPKRNCRKKNWNSSVVQNHN